MKKKFSYLTIMVIMFMFFTLNVQAYSYKTSDIPNNSYVIGTHLFTRKDLNEQYDGTLKTEHIMLASKSISSSNLDDMIIYYKDPRGNWYNELTEEQVQIENEINIEYKNTLPYLLKPKTTSVYNGYENGYYKYEIQIENWQDYCDSDEVENYRFEVYEVNGTEYTKLGESIIGGAIGTPVIVQVEAGKSKTFATKVYTIVNSNVKVYSDYSDEYSIKTSNYQLNKPVFDVKNLIISNNNINGTVYITNTSDYINNNGSIISGFEIYSTVTDGSKPITIEGKDFYYLTRNDSSENLFSLTTNLPFNYTYGEVIPSIVIRVYYTDNSTGMTIYSNFSNPIKVTADRNNNFMVTDLSKPEKPEFDYAVEKISSGTVPYNCETNECGKVFIKLFNNQYKNSNNYYTINGVEFYRSDENGDSLINGEKFSSFQTSSYQNILAFTKDGGIPDLLPIKYAVRTFTLNINNEKIYSDPVIITINSYEEYSKNIYDDTLRKTVGQLAYTVADINGDGQEELILRGPFENVSSVDISYKIFGYDNEDTFTYSNINYNRDTVGVNDCVEEKVYRNNDNSLIVVCKDGHMVNTITLYNNKTLNEVRTFPTVNSSDDILIGDELLTFHSINDNQYLLNDSLMYQKYLEIVNHYYNNSNYAYIDINEDGQYELILNLIGNNDVKINFEVYSYNFYDEYYQISGNPIILSQTTINNKISINSNLEYYLYRNNDNTLMMVYKNENIETIKKYMLNNSNHNLELTYSEERDITNGQMTTGDHLITFNKYTNEDKGC